VLKKFRNGDAAVLHDVYRAYVDSVTDCVGGALRRYGRPGEGAWRAVVAELPALVEEVFAHAFEPSTRRRFASLRDFGPGLSAIARGVIVQHLRRTGRLIAVDPILLLDPVSLQPSRKEWAREREADLEDRHLLALVARHVASLPAALRRAHELLYRHGLSQQEAAAALGVDADTVRMLASHLREGLRDALTQAARTEARPAAQAATNR
jgi:RNA polymerase sigma factor (sigma-70 family)